MARSAANAAGALSPPRPLQFLAQNSRIIRSASKTRGLGIVAMSRCMKQILEPFTAGVDAHAGSDLNRRIISLSSAEDETSAKIISGAEATMNSRERTGHGAPDGPAQFSSPHASRSPPTKDPAPAGGATYLLRWYGTSGDVRSTSKIVEWWKKKTASLRSGQNGGRTRNRTRDTRIFSPPLYQLSYPAKN